MMNITLKKLTEEYAADIRAFREEILKANDNDAFAGCFGLRECLSVEDWIKDTVRLEKEENCPQDRVPSSVYLAVRESDNKVVGIIDLRHHINHPILGEWGGHTGYSVRPCERGKGYAKEMLRQNLENARMLGLKEIMITCDRDNHASEKTILANGGILEKEIIVDGAIMKKYWIKV